MLTDLSFLNVGKKWPPPSECERLETYERNHELFECEHAEVYRDQLRRIERVIGNFEDVVNFTVVLNFQKLMSLKIADLLVGEPPRIVAAEGADSEEQKAIDAIVESSDLINTLYMTAIDVSKDGDGLLYVRRNGKAGIIDVTQPCLWFPVVSPDNARQMLYHVLAWTYTIMANDQETKYLKVFIHSKGSYEAREYLLDGPNIARQTKPATVTSTGLSDFAIVQIPNTITSDRVTGIDDYTDIDSIISEIMVRVGQIERILDKHASPSVQGPQGALEQDPVSHEWKLKMGNYFPREDMQDAPVEYITWDGELAANFTIIEKLTNFLYVISEMGSAIFGDVTKTTGDAPSGTALRRLMMSPLAKVNRIRMRFDPAIKKAVKLCSQLGGLNLTAKQISVIWQDGLPGDPLEEAQIMTFRTASKATMSQKRAMMQYDGLSDVKADEELAQIQDEEAALNPIEAPPLSTLEPSTEPPI